MKVFISSLLLLIHQVLLMNCNLMKSSKAVTTHDIFYPIVSFHQVRPFDKNNRMRRSEDNLSLQEKMNVKFHALGKDFDFNLDLNDKLLAPNFLVETLNAAGRVKQRHTVDNCFYNGRINNRNDTLVSLSNCNGLSGIIQNGGEHYYIRPAKHDERTGRTDVLFKKRAHVIRRTRESFVKEKVKSLARFTRFVYDREESDCGLDDVKPHVRWIRNTKSSKEGEQSIETMMAIDQKMAQFYGMDASKQYALTIANAAHNILRDTTIGPNTVNLILTKLIVLTTPLNDLSINHHARNSLSSFGRWAEGRNNLNNGHPDHYDYAILLTKHDICVDSNQPCETKGLSYVSGMCDGSKSAAIIEDDGFGAAFTMAHQTGHSLGMDHDSVGNPCADSKRIMSTYGAKTADAFHWSSCSADYLQQFLRREQSECLADEPPRRKRTIMKSYDNPGRLSGALLQCQMIFGADSQACLRSRTEEICGELTCIHPVYKNCSGVGIPSMDGTYCGEKKWCKQGACVYRDNERNDNMVDGGWTSWSMYHPCSRSCDGGITYRERFCENPKPKNGGEYCEGDSRSYSICNKQACALPATNFRKQQCEKRGTVYYGDKLLNWTSPQQNDQEDGCELICHSTTTRQVKKYFGHVTDGTDCMISNIKGKCIQGECNMVGCDMVLGSTETFDRCGVCKGDGSTCVVPHDSPLIVAEKKNNIEIANRIDILEKKKNSSVVRVGEQLMKLREVLHKLALKQCADQSACAKDYEKNIIKKTNVAVVPVKFYWHLKSQGCSVSCGRGSEILRATCSRLDDNTQVGDAFCDANAKPNGLVRSCQRTACAPSWAQSKWSSCSKSCGGGTKSRSVYCVLNDGVTEYNMPKTQCNMAEKPTQIASCNLDECPIEWYAEPYGQCSTTCGRGVRSRSVRCRHINKMGVETVLSDARCLSLVMPVTEMLCNVHNPCPGDGNCGGRWTDPSGQITSPNYPANYGDNSECVHEIQSPQDHVITLNFTDVDMKGITTQLHSQQCVGDFLRITEGKCSSSLPRPSIMICGKNAPRLYTSKDNNLCLKFVSDQSGNAKGFSLIYNTSKKQKYSPQVRDICDIQNMILNTSVGVLTSPNYPKYYPPNEDCKVTLNAIDASGFMIKFDAFQVGTRSGVMKCKTDYLEFIYDGKSEAICGSEATIPTIHIPAPQLTIKFHSSLLRLLRTGFVLTYVTKEYARTYAQTKHAIRKIDEYSTTLREWSNRQDTQPNQEINDAPTVSRAASIRKNTIGRAMSDNMINNRKQLIEVLMKLANVSPEKMRKVLMARQNQTLETQTNVQHKQTYASLQQYMWPALSTNFQHTELVQKKRQALPILRLNKTSPGVYRPSDNRLKTMTTTYPKQHGIDNPLIDLTEGIVQKFKEDILRLNSGREPPSHTETTTRSNVPTKPSHGNKPHNQNNLHSSHSTENFLGIVKPQLLPTMRHMNMTPPTMRHMKMAPAMNTNTMKQASNNTTQKKNATVLANATTRYPETNEGVGVRIHKTDIPRPDTFQENLSKFKARPLYEQRNNIARLDMTSPLAKYSPNVLNSISSRHIQDMQSTIPIYTIQQPYNNPVPEWSARVNGDTMWPAQPVAGNNFPVPATLTNQLQGVLRPSLPYIQPINGRFVPNFPVVFATQPSLAMKQFSPYVFPGVNTYQSGFQECSRDSPIRCADSMFLEECYHGNACRDMKQVCCLTDCLPMKFVCIPNG